MVSLLHIQKRSIQEELSSWLADIERVVIAGIGNPIRRDDFVGIRIVQGLKGKVSENVRLLECETVPEGYLLEIEEFNPTHVLLIDSAFLGLKPGEACLVNPAEVSGFSPITTHVLPLRVFCEYIKQATGAKIALLLVEPKSMEFGEGLSSEVEKAAQDITLLLSQLLS